MEQLTLAITPLAGTVKLQDCLFVSPEKDIAEQKIDVMGGLTEKPVNVVVTLLAFMSGDHFNFRSSIIITYKGYKCRGLHLFTSSNVLKTLCRECTRDNLYGKL